MSVTRKGPWIALSSSAMFLAGPSVAADLGSDAVKALVGGKMWIAEQVADARSHTSFEWKADGTVCLRLSDTAGKCDDSGTWRMDGAQVCWKFTWWLKSVDMTTACVSVAELDKGRYQAKVASGNQFMVFSVK
jgi:hypothetical protein